MLRIKRWIDGRRRVVWSEPKLPPYVKFNPNATDPDPDEGIQPGDLSMGPIAEEFLTATEEDAPPVLLISRAR
jgi:hypothetical protein